MDKAQSDSIDFLPDDTTNDTGQEVDTVSSLTDASFYGYSIRGDFTKVAAAQANASYLQNQAGSERFTLPNNGPIENLTGGEKKTEEEKALDAMRDNAEAVQEELKRQREEAYWADRDVTWNNTTLTGSEWKSVSEFLRSQHFRELMRQRGKAEGWTDAQMDEAEQVAPKITDSLARGQKPTAEQEAQIKANPALKAYIDEGIAEAEFAKSKLGQDAEVSDRVVAAQADESAVIKRADILTQENPLSAKVESITPVYSVAAKGETSPSPAPQYATLDKTDNAISVTQKDMGLSF